MLKSLLRPLWHRRHIIVQNTKKIFGWTFSTLGQLPLPPYIKQAVRDVFMLSLDHMVIHTHAYQAWQIQRAGTSRIQHLMRMEQPKDKADEAHLPIAPSKAEWDALAKNMATPENAKLDVIIPVYNGYDQTLNAIYQSLNTRKYNSCSYNVIVIDDASPDKDLSASLESLAQQDLFTLYKNEENLGFVQTVNKGMRLHETHDVILLNSDTEVYHNWVDRMVTAAQSGAKISTVTPLSNNAEICSYPYFVQDNHMTLEVCHAELDELAAQANEKATVEIPTGVGFCMYVARECLNDIGYFDAEEFGKGYGEENDFCRRAVNSGWTHLLACDTYVRHIGGTSFAKSKKKLWTKNYDKLVARYPDYTQIVHDFINQDPVQPYRRALDIARIKRHTSDYTIMMLNHQMGGGTGRHVQELCDALKKEDVGAIVLEPTMSGGSLVAIKHHDVPHTPNLSFSMEYNREELTETLNALSVEHIHMHHWVNYPQRILNFIVQVAHEQGWKYDVTLHDYYTACPRINMVDKSDYYCGEPELKDCERCLEVSPSHSGGIPMWQWRSQFGTLLAAARQIYVPSDDVYKRMQHYYPLKQMEVRVHPESFDTATSLASKHMEGEPLRIAVIGAISKIKGSQILVDAVKDANARDLPLEFILIGHSDHPDINAGMKRLTVTGEYKEDEIGNLLASHRPHLAFIPSIWPETYCYTLSIAWLYGIMPAVFDIGAPAGRIRAIKGHAGEILDYALAHDSEKLNDWFVAYEATSNEPAKPANISYASYKKDYYKLSTSKGKAATKKAA